MSFRGVKVDVPKDLCHVLYQHFSTADPYKVYPDVLPTLQKLSSAGVIMGVLSDFDVRLQGILEGLGISPYFEFVVQSLVEGYSKPSRELWRAVLRKAGTRDVLGYHVGDEPGKDGFVDARTVIVDRENEIVTDFVRISSLKELPDLLYL